MKENSLQPKFTSSLNKREYILVIPYIFMHLLVLPLLFSRIIPEADTAVLNVAVYGTGMAYMLLAGRRILRCDFDALCDSFPFILMVVAGSYIRMMVSNYGVNEIMYRCFDLIDGKPAPVNFTFFAALLLMCSPLLAELTAAYLRRVSQLNPGKAAFISTAWWIAQAGALYCCIIALAGRILEEVGLNPNTEGVAGLAAGNNYGLIFGMTVFMAPIVEEMIFRAGIFGLIRHKNRIAAYVVGILSFSIYHMAGYAGQGISNLLFALQYIPISFLLCRSYEKTNCIWTSIFLHMAVNGISMQVLQLL